jgi:hypothetical protein
MHGSADAAVVDGEAVKGAVCAAALLGCAAEPHATLPADAYFTTPDACTPYSWSCARELALCHTGHAGMRVGDVVNEGRYNLEGSIAVITLTDGSFKLDVASATQTAGSNGNEWAWIPDTKGRYMTLEWDVTDCNLPPM